VYGTIAQMSPLWTCNLHTASENVWTRKRTGHRIRHGRREAEGRNSSWSGSNHWTGNPHRVCVGGVRLSDCPAGWRRRASSVNSCAADRHNRMAADSGGWHSSAASRTCVTIHDCVFECLFSL